MDTTELIKKVKDILEKEAIKENDAVNTFSNDVITFAYQKLSNNIQDIMQTEEDPMVISEMLKSYLETTKLINEKDLQKQQVLLKLFEQLNKYEQSRYY